MKTTKENFKTMLISMLQEKKAAGYKKFTTVPWEIKEFGTFQPLV